MEKTESRSKIVTKSQQSLLNKSNRIENRSILSSDIDRLDCKGPFTKDVRQNVRFFTPSPLPCPSLSEFDNPLPPWTSSML